MEAKDRKRKKRKKRKNLEAEEEIFTIDRLSCLPDSVLSHIFSFLDTVSAVRTSILSRRYRFLWTYSPTVDFKVLRLSSSRIRPYCAHDLFDEKDVNVVSFESFVNHVLEFREHSNLTTFRLSLHVPVGSDFIGNCIDYAVRHKVQHLRIRACTKRKTVILPRLLLSSPSLATLCLNNAVNASIELPKSLSLPNLKILQLKKFEFSDGNYNGEVFSGCPKLESLTLNKCWVRPGSKIKILEVDCLNLKSLDIRYWRSPWRCFYEHAIRVNAPLLDSFNFQGHSVRVDFKDGIPCLNKAWIDLIYPMACTSVNVSERRRSTSESLITMLRQLCNVKYLSLSFNTIEVLCAKLDLRGYSLSVFENLRLIKFTSEEKYVEKAIPIATLVESMKNVTSDILLLDVSKEQTYSLSSVTVDPKVEDTIPFAIPVHVMYFLLESSPSVEFLNIEVPKKCIP